MHSLILVKEHVGLILQDIYLKYFIIFGSNLAHTLINHSKMYGISYNCKVCLQVPKNDSSQNRVVSV